MNSKKYLLGLDLGTNSVGWCLTDENYNVVKVKGKSLHGIRRFEEAKAKAEQRVFRTARRRLQRRRERIELLQKLFAEEISKIDENFFNKLDQSFLHKEDRILDSEFYLPEDINENKFKTIYHLRKHLLESAEKEDIRAIYLALHHMIKYRGHFLYNSFDPKNNSNLKDAFSILNEQIAKLGLDESFNFDYKDDFTNLIMDIKGVNDAKVAYKNYFKSEKKSIINNYIELMAGATIKVKKLFNLDPEEEEEFDEELGNKSVCFKLEAYDELISEISAHFSQRVEVSIITTLKEIYDSINLFKILGESDNISTAMIDVYNLHKNQLKEFKAMIREYLGNSAYNEMFREFKDVNNYSKYIGSVQTKTRQISGSHASQEDFYKYVKSVLTQIKTKDERATSYCDKVLKEIDNNTFLPRMNTAYYSNLPYQLNLMELQTIIKKQSKFYDFFNIKDEYGTIADKISSIIEYRIPYFVGPLISNRENDIRGKHAWLERTDEKIYPWNLDKVVNIEQTQVNFIDRMLNTCSYLKDQKCLPKDSIILQYFNVLSEVNKIFINGCAISNEIKNDLIKNLYLVKKVTKKNLLEYFKSISGEDVKLTSSNNKELDYINSSMSTYIDFKNIFGESFIRENINMIEDIIRDIAIFTEAKTLEKRLKTKYTSLDDKQISRLSKLRYSGFGRLSKKLLCDIKVFVNDSISVSEYGEVLETSIIETMRLSNSNLMELVGINNAPFKEKIDEYNKELNLDYSDYNSYIEEQYVSPGMKKPLLQSMKIIDELEKIIKAPIDEFYIETVRSNKADKKKTVSRKERLQEIYKEAAKISKDVEISKISNLLNEQIDSKLNSEKVYLYFMQFGKDAYSLEKINFDDLFTDKYDVDHIVPQSLLKDDSFENKVLTSREINANKGDTFPIKDGLLSSDAVNFYTFLKNNKLMGSKKYHNLTRKDELTDNEIASFVNRQLVYTSQATKGLKDVIEKFKNTNDHKVKVVFSKAENISDFRHEFDLLKSRTANNFHHAHDAYLNIVIGRTIDTYYFNGVFSKIREMYLAKKLTMNNMKIFKDENKVVKNLAGEVVWNYEMMEKVKKYVKTRFDFLTTWQETVSNNVIAKVSLQNTNSAIPVKNINDPKNFKEFALSKLSNASRYGGYTSLAYAHYTLIEHVVKNNKKVTLCNIPLYHVSNTNNVDILKLYIEDTYGYKEVKILLPLVKTKVTLRNGNSEVTIRNMSISINGRNTKELIYSYEQIKLIKKMENYIKRIKELKLNTNTIYEKSNEEYQQNFIFNESSVSLNLSKKNQNTQEIIYTDLDEFFKYIQFSLKTKNIYKNFGSIENFSLNLCNDAVYTNFTNLNIFQKMEILLNLVSYLSGSVDTCDLKLIGLAANAGKVQLSSTLTKGMKLISKSVTGFYEKLLYEIK